MTRASRKTENGFEDEDGCPDEIPEDIKRFSGIVEGIHFDTGKATIKAKSAKILKKAAEVLESYPNIRVKIDGHTDSRGSDELNKDLSRRRAESVKQWLVDQGIDESRLETEGHGPDQPIESNESKAGRAANRRIEFTLL
jgi:outer membrane protein OmpA-like peptidoglycan-associated protein